MAAGVGERRVEIVEEVVAVSKLVDGAGADRGDQSGLGPQPGGDAEGQSRGRATTPTVRPAATSARHVRFSPW